MREMSAGIRWVRKRISFERRNRPHIREVGISKSWVRKSRCRGQDSNLGTPTRADLESAAFGRSATPARALGGGPSLRAFLLIEVGLGTGLEPLVNEDRLVATDRPVRHFLRRERAGRSVLDRESTDPATA
jgi:hypothetical protein